MVAEWRNSTVVTKLIKNFKSLYGFGGRCLDIRDVMDFEPCFKLYNLVSVHPKSIKLSQMVKWSFMWLCQFIDWLKFETRSSSLLNFGMAYTTRSGIRSDEGLTLETSAFESLYGGKFTLSIKPNYLISSKPILRTENPALETKNTGIWLVITCKLIWGNRDQIFSSVNEKIRSQIGDPMLSIIR